jgi:hypothetical protein
VVERLEYIEVVQQGREKENHGIQLVGKSSLDRMKKYFKYWVKMTWDPHQEIQKQWGKCQKHWGKINKVMKDVRLPEFDTLDEFTNLRDVFKMHSIQDSLWAEECTKVIDVDPGQVQQFAGHLIRA